VPEKFLTDEHLNFCACVEDSYNMPVLLSTAATTITLRSLIQTHGFIFV